MKRKTYYKFQKSPKAVKKKTALKRTIPANRKTSSRDYFVKKKRRKTKILTISAFFIIFLILGIYILFFTKIFEIKHIEVKFINEKYLASESEIKNTIYSMLDKKYLYILPQNNLLLFSKSDLKGLMQGDSRIKLVNLNKKWPPASLFIKIIETQPVVQLVVYGDGGEYYLNSMGEVIVPSRENEFIVASADNRGDSDGDFVTIEKGRNDFQDFTMSERHDEYSTTTERRRYSDRDFATIEKGRNDFQDFTTIINKRRDNLAFTTQDEGGEKGKKNNYESDEKKNKEEEKNKNMPSYTTMVIIDDSREKKENALLPIFYDKTSTNLKDQKIVTLFKNILDFINNTYLDEIGIYIPMVKITENGGIYEIEMTTTEGWQIFINSEVDFNKQLSNLELILKEKIQQRELLKYIDLRFGKKIFYKLK